MLKGEVFVFDRMITNIALHIIPIMRTAQGQIELSLEHDKERFSQRSLSIIIFSSGFRHHFSLEPNLMSFNIKSKALSQTIAKN